MRDYGIVRPTFWTGSTGKVLRGDADAIAVANYLMTSPYANLIGLYYLPIATLAHELGFSVDRASKALRRVCDVGFAKYDEPTDYVFVLNFAREQVGRTLKASDKRVKGVVSELRKHRKCPFFGHFVGRYKDPYALDQFLTQEELATAEGKGHGSPFGAPPMPGSGSGAGPGPGSSLSLAPRAGARVREDDPEPVRMPTEPPPGGEFTPARMQVLFRRAWLEAYQDDPSMGGRNVGDFFSRVVAAAAKRQRDPEELFLAALERWLQHRMTDVELRAPYACFAQAWGQLLQSGTRDVRHGVASPAPAEAFSPTNLDDLFGPGGTR